MIGAAPLPHPFDTAAAQLALVACLAVGAFAPALGAFLVQKRLSLIGDGVGHVAYAGVGLGLLTGVWPVWTALLFAMGGAIGVELLRSRRRAGGDLALALFFYAGLALGAVFATKAGDVELETLPYLFGDPLAVTGAGVAAVGGAGVIVAAGAWALRRVLFAIVTDDEWSRVAGLPVQALNVALAAVTAAVIVAGMRIVGLLLVAALMVLPVASAQLLGRSFRGTVVLATAIGAASAVVGLALGIVFGISASGAIVLVAAAVFAGTSVVRRTTPATMEHAT